MSATWTISGVQEALASKKISARELAADYYKRIDARNAQLNAYLTLSQDRAFAQADHVDALVAAGKPLPPLAGVPLAVKDVISTRGVRTTCGSKILENYIPPYDATAVEAAGKPLPPLAGVPLAVKDVISTRGVRTTCGSKILENYIPPYDATAVERLEAA